MNEAGGNRAELWLTLAQAFLPPLRPEVADAFRQDLAADLEPLCCDLGAGASDAMQALRESLTEFPNGQALLVHYSALFLAPPVRAHLNLGYYLDGTLNGPSLDALEAWYRHYGVGRAPGFHDLPDHLAMVLEFVSMLARADETKAQAAEVVRRFVLPALPRLERALLDAGVADSPYLHLMRLAAAATQPFAWEAGEGSERKRNRRRIDPSRGEWRHCARCGAPFAREKELRVITLALAEQGLPAAHLGVCPDCRDPGQGWQKRAIR